MTIGTISFTPKQREKHAVYVVVVRLYKDSKDSASPPPPPVYLEQGAPMVGMAELEIDFPIGAQWEAIPADVDTWVALEK